MSILIRKSGILATLQDGGRTGYRDIGVNPSGPMDSFASRIANIILGNEQSQTVIETHFPAVEIEFHDESSFAICGAEFSAHLDNKPLRNWSSHYALVGQRLTFKRPELGSRAYVAFAGGIESKRWLGSCASIRLVQDDRLTIGRSSNSGNSLSGSPWLLPRYSRLPTIRVVRGPEFSLLDDAAIDQFLSENYTFSNGSNRMGARLDGLPISCEKVGEMTSTGVTFGTIQLLPSGLPVVLMADHQTTGGYPRIATVISVDLPLIGQLSAGDGVSFKLIEYAEAIELLEQRERDIDQLRRGVSLANSAWKAE